MGNCKSAIDLFLLSKDERIQDRPLSSVFCVDRGSTHVQGFQELVLCPSRHGAHVVRVKDGAVIFKIKHLTGVDKEYAQFHLVEMNNDRSSHIPIASMEKARTELSAKQGSYSMVQAWHMGSHKLQVKERRPMLSRQKVRKVRTPVETSSLNLYLKVTGKRDPTRGRSAEIWNAEFKVSDTSYTMKVDGQSHRSLEELKGVRIYHEDELVCTGFMQTFASHDRQCHERPFVGVQLKADSLRPTRQGGHALPTLKSSLSNASKTSEDVASASSLQPPPEDILPLLMVIAWGEEAVTPPHDLRRHFIARMRREDGDDSRATTDIGWEALAAVPGEKQNEVVDSEMVEDNTRIDIDWELQAPMPPCQAISTHKTQKMLSAERNAGPPKPFSLSGI